MKVAIIGGGAAGFFSAIAVKNNYPHAEVTIFEKSKKVLSKVKISGGGRCNVTNNCPDIDELSRAYPRNSKKLKQAFYSFNTQDTMEWFESRGIPLTTQEDRCVFPVSQNSQSFIDCFLKETREKNIAVKISSSIKAIQPIENGIKLSINEEDLIFDKVIVCTGGSPKKTGLEWLENLGHKIEDPVPSLFTFNMPSEKIKQLMGVVVEKALVRIQGEKLLGDGPLLITHWGMSGPAILKLSSFGARILNERNYTFTIQVNWVNEINEQIVSEKVKEISEEHHLKNLGSIRPYYIPTRLWHFLLEKYELPLDRKWHEIGKKGLNKITNLLTNDIYSVNGKTTFKEEFVTCGGVSLDSVNFKTMKSKVVPGLYFAGEVLDIDGITGGYNFQAAWTTAFIAGKLK